MRQLILDRAAIELAAVKLAGTPIFAGPDGRLLAPGIIDVVEGDSAGGEPPWCPANELARLFVAGSEACRDIAFHAPNALDPRSRRRALKSLTVPVCSLMDVVHAISRELNVERLRRHRDESWLTGDRSTYSRVGKRFRKQRLNGPVRKMRHKLGAHLDPGAFGPATPSLDPDDLLGAMGDALALLMLGLNHPSDCFSWIRYLGDVHPDLGVVETMQSYPTTVRWVVDQTGRVRDVLPVRLAEDPRKQIQADVCATIVTYNSLLGATSSSLGPMNVTFNAPRGAGVGVQNEP